MKTARNGISLGLAAVCLAMTTAGFPMAAADHLTVVSVQPMPGGVSAQTDAAIFVKFDRPVNRASLVPGSSFMVMGRWSGPATPRDGLSFADGDRTVIWLPDQPLSAGETVTVALSHDVQAADGSFLRSAGYGFAFWTHARTADLDLDEIDSMSTRTMPDQGTRSYGGIASDLNGDRFCDLTIVNEDSEDLRVFLNKADRTGLYEDFIQPTFPVNDRASPSEPADFNRDGFVDICVANIDADTISILLGNGDGTFGPQQEVTVGNAPRGIAAFDADGDGDADIVNTNADSSNLSILLNDGSGFFGAPTFFEGGAAQEWALAAADMNGDGIFDLVIGAQSAQRVIVMLGNGDGTFTTHTVQNSGGFPWMINAGDLDGDGDADVAVVNSFSNKGAILFGNGAGGLSGPTSYATDPFALGSDLGDLDGDGDLDWITSSFSGDWRIFLNNGSGVFSFLQEVNAPSAASCSLPVDIDNDGDLDLALIDELADLVILMQNSGTSPVLGDLNDDCRIDLADYASFQDCVSGPGICAAGGCATVDFDDDCDVDFIDFGAFQRVFLGSDNEIPNC